MPPAPSSHYSDPSSMAAVTAHAGVCGSRRTIAAESEAGQNVALSRETTCPQGRKTTTELHALSYRPCRNCPFRPTCLL
jgi:hypothetical protein